MTRSITIKPSGVICPDCETFLTPASQPADGDLARCPTCGGIAAFRADGTLRAATAAERRRFYGLEVVAP